MTSMVHAEEWGVAGIVAEGEPINLDGINPWGLEWRRVQDDPVMLRHPQYLQWHRFWVYQLTSAGKVVTFAAGELSANVWGFYLPTSK